jgi:N-acetyl-anhydromuramyl-L-alanine amidase AmpD
MAEPSSPTENADAFKVANGIVTSPQVIQKLYAGIEKGKLDTVHAIVVHQTGSGDSSSAFESYKSGNNGAHFLVDKDGTIYQTARINQKCQHVGSIKSRCYETKSCSDDELKEVKSILFKKGQIYSTRVKSLSDHERSKSYPERYPSNSDSIGVEIVGGVSNKGGAQIYEVLNPEQTASLKWLINNLSTALSLRDKDVYRHPEVSYKNPSEASSASWK